MILISHFHGGFDTSDEALKRLRTLNRIAHEVVPGRGWEYTGDIADFNAAYPWNFLAEKEHGNTHIYVTHYNHFMEP